MSLPGSITNRERASQLRDFSGLCFVRGISPTDIDGAMDFHGNLFIFIELKFGSTPMPSGQRRFLSNLCEAITRGGRECVVFVSEHSTPIGEDIDAANSRVREVYCNGNWHSFPAVLTLHNAIESFLSK